MDIFEFGDEDQELPAPSYRRSRPLNFNNSTWQATSVYSSSSESDEESEVTTQHRVPTTNKRKRKYLGKENYAENVSKRRRAAGLPYTGRNTKKLMPARAIGPPCQCKAKCFDKLGRDRIQTIFHNFWQIPSDAEKEAYINFLVQQKPVAERRVQGSTRRAKNKKKECLSKKEMQKMGYITVIWVLTTV